MRSLYVTTLLYHFLLPFKSIAIAYITFFGLYGTIKLFCEQINIVVAGCQVCIFQYMPDSYVFNAGLFC